MTDSSHLRLVWPQWQGAGASSVTELAAEFPLGTAHRGYAIGSRVLEAVLPPHDGPTEHVPVEMSDRGRATEDGVESKQIVLEQLEAALTLIGRHDPERISTLGGECSVSVAPFSALAARYGDDLAIVWIDAHPDVDTGETSYDGYHAMALALLTGHGDPELLAKLPGTVDTSRVLLAGTHAAEPDAWANVEAWGIGRLGPDELRESSAPLLDWLRATGCSTVAVHLDVDVIDADEAYLGLGGESGGLSTAQVRRIIADLQQEADVVALSVAEFFPRPVMRALSLLDGMPLLGD